MKNLNTDINLKIEIKQGEIQQIELINTNSSGHFINNYTTTPSQLTVPCKVCGKQIRLSKALIPDKIKEQQRKLKDILHMDREIPSELSIDEQNNAVKVKIKEEISIPVYCTKQEMVAEQL